jgi:hypothetical protein
MKPNIFQKIAFLVYISVIVLICVYFVPYHGTQNYLGVMMENIKRDSSYHSNILDEGFGTISYFRFLFYLGIPGLLVYFVYGYLDKLNDLDTKVYYKKAKNELYIFLLFLLINLGLIFFLYGKNIYSENKKNPINNEISSINKSIEEIDKNLSYRYRIFTIISDEYYQDSSWTEEVFYSYVDNEVGFLSPMYDFLKEKSEMIESEETFNSLMKIKTPDEILFLKNKRAELDKKLEINSEKLNQITFYSGEDVRHYILITFLASFILLYIIRPLFSIFKGILKEVR